ncbi:MAG: RNA polymerase sigma factor [bacterium]|nr:RNA polymerase sigma factor [bacterium]
MSESLENGFNKRRGERGDATPLTPEEEKFNKELIELRPELMHKARSLTNNRAVAEDLAQETLHKALKSREQFKANTSLRAWVNTILTRTHIDSHRRLDSRLVERGEGAQIIIDNMATPGNQEHVVALGRTLGHMNDLTSQQKKALVLDTLGYTEKEIGAKMRIGAKTIKRHVQEGRNALKEKSK